MEIIKEGQAKVYAEKQNIVNKKMEVFYNPVMVVNRDFSLLIINTLKKKEITIGDVLAGSGIRSIRLLKEITQKNMKIIVNDKKSKFEELMNKNLKLNNIKTEDVEIRNEDANKTLLSQHFDYIEIDPFGTPNPFLDNAIKAIRREGIISITATDTSALCGSYPAACERKYWAKPLRNELMHEFGARILIRKVQLLGAHHEKALNPILTYATDHYIKIFLKSTNSKEEIKKILKQHETYKDKGPIWTGPIHDEKIIKEITENKDEIPIHKNTERILNIIKDEITIKEPFFYDMHREAKELKLKNIPKTQDVIAELKEKKYKATRTHFKDTSIKTNAEKREFLKILKTISSN